MPQVVLMCGQEVRERFSVADGTAIQEVMLARNPATGNWPAPTICIFGGQPLKRDAWMLTFLRGDDVAVFAELPMGGGGGSNPLQVIFTIAIIAAMIMVPQMQVFAVGGALAGWGPAAAAGIGLVGSLVSGLLFSKPSGQIGAQSAAQASPTYSINGSSNQARLYQPVPELFGKMRIVPDLVADKWAQYIDNEMYLYQVFGCGRGSYVPHEMSFGDVVFWRDGRIIESAYTSESGEEYINAINADLVAVADGGGWYGPYDATDSSAATLNLTIDFPQGLCAFTASTNAETGELVWLPAEATASFVAEYREKGTAGWQHLDSQSVTKATTQAFSLPLSGKAPGFDVWEVRIRNTSVIPDNSFGPGPYNPPSTPNRKQAILTNVSSIGPSISVQFVESGGTVTLFPDNVDTSPNVASQELIAPNDEGHDWIGPFVTNAPGTRTDTILYSFVFPSGLGRYDSKGKLKSYSVTFEIQYRTVDDNDNPLSGWRTLRKKTYTAGTMTAQRNTESCSVQPGRYQTRVRRTSDKRTDNKAIETLQWESMTAMIPGSLHYDQTTVAVKIKATNVLSQSAADSFAIVQTRKLPLYDRISGTWSEAQPTRSFAAALSHVCKASYGGRLTDKQIDLDALWRIDEELAAMDWHYDAWVDGAYTVWTLVLEMCNSVRVVPRPAGTVLSFIMDKAGRPVRHVFTPHDIVRGSFIPTWNTFEENTPDDVTVSYLDETADYMQREVRAVLPESESRSPVGQNYLGIVNRDHAHKMGLFRAACNRWRRMGCEFDTEGMGRLLNLGDVISITHPRFRNTLSGTLAGWDEKALTLQLSSKVTITEDIVPYMSLSRPDGSVWGPVKLLWVDCDLVRFDPADYAALLLQGFESPFSWLTVGEDRLPTVWTFQQGREFTRRYIITGITPQSVYRYHITCINDSDKVDSYDIPTPPWEFRSNLPIQDTIPAPPNLQVTLTEAPLEDSLSATWSEVHGATGYEVQTSADGVTWVRYGQVNTSSVQFAVSDDVSWLRVATARGYDLSSWVVSYRYGNA